MLFRSAQSPTDRAIIEGCRIATFTRRPVAASMPVRQESADRWRVDLRADAGEDTSNDDAGTPDRAARRNSASASRRQRAVQNRCGMPPERRCWKGRLQADRVQTPWPNAARCATGLPARPGGGITVAAPACAVAGPLKTGGTRLARDPRSGMKTSVMPSPLRRHRRGRGRVHRPPRALKPPARRPRPRSAAAGSAARPPGRRTRRRPRSCPGVTPPS